MPTTRPPSPRPAAPRSSPPKWLAALAIMFAAAGGLARASQDAPPSTAQPAPATQPAPTSGGPVDRALIDDLVIANRVLAEQGVLDAFGHVSVRHPGNPQRFLMSRSLAPALVTADDIMEYDLNGNPVDARGRASFLERFIHAEIYRARPDVRAVIHSHALDVIPFGVTQTPLRPIALVAAFLSPRVPVFEIRRAGGTTDMLVSTPQLGRALAETLGANAVALMRGHGMVVVAPTIPLAVYRAVYTMVDARLQAQALALGGPITFLDPEEADNANKVLDQVHLRAWDLWKREVAARMSK